MLFISSQLFLHGSENPLEFIISSCELGSIVTGHFKQITSSAVHTFFVTSKSICAVWSRSWCRLLNVGHLYTFSHLFLISAANLYVEWPKTICFRLIKACFFITDGTPACWTIMVFRHSSLNHKKLATLSKQTNKLCFTLRPPPLGLS